MCALAVNEVSKRSNVASTTISLTGVSKVFENGTTALSDVSLSFRAGEFVSLLGASGCGKSTLLRLIAGLSEPSAGNVEWHDGGQRDEHPLGYVFQDPTLMPWASVFSNVWLPLRLSGMSRKDAQDQVMEALELVGLAEQVDQRPNELSGGMKMRVSIARALVTRPKVLLLDEPFAALDEITRFKLNDDLLSLWERFGWTIVFVTHSVFEAVYLSNRILVMGANPGRIVHDVCVKLPQSRTETMRMTPEYSVECDKVSQLLKLS